jgi:hypothetical protein
MVTLQFAAAQHASPRKKATLPSPGNLFKTKTIPRGFPARLRKPHSEFTALQHGLTLRLHWGCLACFAPSGFR